MIRTACCFEHYKQEIQKHRAIGYCEPRLSVVQSKLILICISPTSCLTETHLLLQGNPVISHGEGSALVYKFTLVLFWKTRFAQEGSAPCMFKCSIITDYQNQSQHLENPSDLNPAIFGTMEKLKRQILSEEQLFKKKIGKEVLPHLNEDMSNQRKKLQSLYHIQSQSLW